MHKDEAKADHHDTVQSPTQGPDVHKGESKADCSDPEQSPTQGPDVHNDKDKAVWIHRHSLWAIL